MNHKRLTPAFSMLELIFVIVILGIVASIGSEMIAKVYESYIVQRAQHSATLKTELAAAQIVNRLASAIPGTVYRRITPAGTPEGVNDLMSLDPSGNTYTVLQWVGSDVESFNTFNTTNTKVGWSGFCDISISTKNTIITPGSDLSIVNTIRTYLDAPTNFAIYFPYDSTPYFGTVTTGTTDSISLDNNTSHIVEHYKMARTSYALVAEDNTEGGRDLYLYYNFSPSPAPHLLNPAIIGNGDKSLLMKNVSTFKFQGAGRTIRFKICKQEPISGDVNITSCKEKAVF